MSIVRNFKIVLRKSPAVFFPGQNIQGVVLFSSERKIETTGVYIELTGVTYVKFEVKPDHGKPGGTSYSSLDKHCHSTIVLASKGGAEFCLSAGTYQYHFTTQLPEELPTSLECEHGYTRYYLRAYISLPSQEDPDCILPFTVITFFNLNESVYAKRSEEAEDLQAVGCCKKWVKINLKIAKSGYVPGEFLQVEVACDNQTPGILSHASVSLVMEIFALSREGLLSNEVALIVMMRQHSFIDSQSLFKPDLLNQSNTVALRTQDKDLLTERVIRSWPVREMPAYSNVSLTDLELVVPPLPPSGSRFCNNIDIHYKLKFHVPLTPQTNCTASTDLLIGNVPLDCCHSNFSEPHESFDIKDIINISDERDQEMLNNNQVVPVLKCEDRFAVTVENYFLLPDSKNRWNSVPLQCGKIKWSPTYLFYVKTRNKDS